MNPRKVTFKVKQALFPVQPLPPPLTYKFLCTEKATSAKFTVKYNKSNDRLSTYYSRAENKLANDPIVFEGEADFAEDVAELKWDGRDTSDAKRFIVRGDAANYFVEVSASACPDVPMTGPTGGLIVARPRANLMGHQYPAPFVAILNGSFSPKPGDILASEGFFSNLPAIGGVLETIVPGDEFKLNGYEPIPVAPNDAPLLKIQARWEGSAVFVFQGHSDGARLITYDGVELPGAGQGPDIVEYIYERSGAIGPVPGKLPPYLEKALGDRSIDFPKHMKNTELVILNSCCTASPITGAEGNLKGKSLIDVCRDRGADVAIGWVRVELASTFTDFATALFQDQEKKNGTFHTLRESIKAGRDKVEAPDDDSIVRVVTAPGVDTTNVRMADLPRYGKSKKK
ncbi:MAG: hypothetical protein FD180_865 [Planctomycetota bacterium]|nr:MAG: hypothetical protein FD180_865 [Planctomycetota bacterium]